MRAAKIILSDFLGLIRVCGPLVACRWLFQILLHLKTCISTGSLQSADIAMGEGPFHVRYGNARAILQGYMVIGGIREIWVRDVYLGHGYLSIPPNANVLDLGANAGNFTALALAHGTNVHAVAVEASNPARLTQLFALNGWSNRTKIISKFVGGKTPWQEDAAKNHDFANASWITEDELLRECNFDRIDFLKCDIEGSEFALLTPTSKLLAITQQLSIEVHDHAGNRQQFIDMLKAMGFEVVIRISAPGDCVLNARRIAKG